MPGEIEELLVDYDQLEEISGELTLEAQKLRENTLWYAPFSYASGKYTSLSVCLSIGNVFSDYMKCMNGISETLSYENEILKSVVEELKSFDESASVEEGN